MLYSKTTNSFFCPDYNTNIPEDAIEISDEVYANLLKDISENRVLSSDQQGYPCTQEQKETLEEQILKERLWRNAELSRADIELNKVQDSHPKAKGTVTAWRAYRNALRDFPLAEGFPDKSARPLAPDL